jgi:hypothetical protein
VYLYLSLVKNISLEKWIRIDGCILLIDHTCILGPDLRGITIDQGFCEEQIDLESIFVAWQYNSKIPL